MKKLQWACLCLVILASCTLSPVKDPFVYNQGCPHVCWLDINPGVTTAEDAKKLIASSNKIDPYIMNENGIAVEWFTKQMGVNPARVGVVIEDGIVESLNFLFPASVQIHEFITLLREPDEISVKEVKAAEVIYIEYVLYYESAKVIILANSLSKNNLASNNSVKILLLNTNTDDLNAPNWSLQHQGFRQPWVGFEYLEEYLENQP